MKNRVWNIAVFGAFTTATVTLPTVAQTPVKPTPPGLTAVLRFGSSSPAPSGKAWDAFTISVAPGTRVPFTYTVTNKSPAPVTLRFNSGQQTDFVITSPKGVSVWKASTDRMYPMMLTNLVLRPGESKSFTESWTVPAGTAPGKYRVQAFLTTSPSFAPPQKQTALASAQFTVTAPPKNKTFSSL